MKKMKNNNFSLNDGEKNNYFFAENFCTFSCKLKNHSNYHKSISSCSRDT